MEGVPFFPELDPEDEEDSSIEKKDKKAKKDRKLPALFEIDKKTDDKPEKKTEKPEPPLEKLADDEKQAVAADYVDKRAEQVKGELAGVVSESPDEAALLADAALLEAISERLENDEPINEQTLDDATSEVIEALGLDAEDTDEEEPPVVATPPAATSSGSGSVTGSPPPPPPPSPVPPTPIAPPPIPPIGSPPPIIPPAGFNAPPATPNITPNIAANQAPSQEQDRHSHVPYVLAGGIVGYLLGRRRGRIKTEKKLLPVQQKLEKEVKDLHGILAVREQKIRSLAHEQVSKKPELKQRIIERLQEKYDKPETPPVAKKQELRERIIERLQEKYEKPERLGKMVISAERLKPPVRMPEVLIDVNRMSRGEVLVVAERIAFENSNARRLFESNRLNENGLRKVVKAFLNGERIERVINEVMVTPETYNYAETLQAGGAGIDNQGVSGGSSSWHQSSPNPQIQSAKQPAQSLSQQVVQPDQKISAQQKNRIILPTVVLAVVIALVVIVLTR